jgi:hypothetical protein
VGRRGEEGSEDGFARVVFSCSLYDRCELCTVSSVPFNFQRSLRVGSGRTESRSGYRGDGVGICYARVPHRDLLFSSYSLDVKDHHMIDCVSSVRGATRGDRE